MADNTILEQAVTAGDTLATDDIGAYKIPISPRSTQVPMVWMAEL